MIGDLIQRRLTEKDWNQSQLAIHTGLSQAYISKLIRGQVKLPNQETLKKLGIPLNISLTEFYRAAGVLGDTEVDELVSDENPLTVDVIPYIETWTALATRLKAVRDTNPEHYEKLVGLLREGWRTHAEHTIGLYELMQLHPGSAMVWPLHPRGHAR